MIRKFGSMPEEMPVGFFKAVSFPVLAKLDKATPDGRMLDHMGAGVRELPLSIMAQFSQSVGGHDGATVTGALFEVTIDPDMGVMSGRGFLLNDEFGRRHARLIRTGAMRGNSVDLADVEARFEEDMQSGEQMLRFTKWNLAATTGVSKPAFAEAYAEVEDDMSDEEMVAAMGDPMEPLVAEFDEVDFDIVVNVAEEITASSTLTQRFEAFYLPEADKPQKIVVDEHGFVFGHLGLWESCHDGKAGACVRIPRQPDNYASFNKPGVLTDRGIVETGPIFAFGGHRSAKSANTIEDAYGGIENAWADVRVSEGRFGPWISGVIRPGVPDEVVYAARASRISGHWVGGKLKAIVSVNAEGFDVPGSGSALPEFAFSTSDEGVMELIASFPACLVNDSAEVGIVEADDNDDLEEFADLLAEVDEEFAPSLTPPRGARAEAARGLRWVREGFGGDGLEPATIERARSMARGEERSPDTVRRMRDYFNRHQSDKNAEGFSPGEDGYPSPGRVAWALWGGDAGWAWAKRTSEALDRESENSTSTEHAADDVVLEGLLLRMLTEE